MKRVKIPKLILKDIATDDIKYTCESKSMDKLVALETILKRYLDETKCKIYIEKE